MGNWGKGLIAAALLAAAAVVCSLVIMDRTAPAAAAGPAAPGRIAGKPDFNGIWEANNTANWDLLTHEARPMVAQPGLLPNTVVLAAPVLALGSIGWVPAGLGVVEGDTIPYKPWAAARKKENQEHWLDRDPEIKCFPAWNSAWHVHAAPVSDYSERSQDPDDFRVCQRAAHDPPE